MTLRSTFLREQEMRNPPADPNPTAPNIPVDERDMLKLNNLVITFASEVMLLLKRHPNPTRSYQDPLQCIAKLATTSTFENIAPMYATGTAVARTLNALLDLSKKATPTTSNLPPTNNDLQDSRPQQVQPYRTALCLTPSTRPVRRLPPINLNKAEVPAIEPPLQRQTLARIRTMVTRTIGFEEHKIAKFAAEKYLRGPQHFRKLLQAGGFPGAVVVVNCHINTQLYVIAQRSQLLTIRACYDRIRNLMNNSNHELPPIQLDEPSEVTALFRDTTSQRTAYASIANEALRLDNPNIKWPPKTYFIDALHRMGNQLIEKIKATSPQYPIISANRQRMVSSSENQTPRKRLHIPEQREGTQHQQTASTKLQTRTHPLQQQRIQRQQEEQSEKQPQFPQPTNMNVVEEENQNE